MSAFVEGWTQVRVLGEGTYGEVRLLVSAKGEPVAMKVIDMVAARQRNETDAIVREIRILRALRGHDSVIRFYSHRVTDDAAYIFLEYADGGELFDQIEPDDGMPSERAQSYFRQLIQGVQFIHEHGVVHRDIKPENLLLTQSNQLKISDFGLATVFFVPNRGERMCQSRCGTLPYVAPEVISGKLYRGPPTDVWSCGIVLVAMLSGQLPWDKPSIDCPAYNAWCCSASHDAAPWSRIGTGVMGLLCSMLKPIVSQRATIKTIMANPWFTADLSRHRVQFTRQHSRSISNLNVNGAKALGSRKRKLLDASDIGASQPVAMHASSFLDHRINPSADSDTENSNMSNCSDFDLGNSIATTSFSQPANLDNLVIPANNEMTQTQTQGSDPLLRFVRRMTRFIVNVDLTTINKHIQGVCLRNGKQIKVIAANQLLVSSTDRRKDVLKYNVYLFDMGAGRVLVDCRRSMGDGLEFKREFMVLKADLQPYICRDGGHCLRDNGYVVDGQITQQLQRLSTQSSQCLA